MDYKTKAANYLEEIVCSKFPTWNAMQKYLSSRLNPQEKAKVKKAFEEVEYIDMNSFRFLREAELGPGSINNLTAIIFDAIRENLDYAIGGIDTDDEKIGEYVIQTEKLLPGLKRDIYQSIKHTIFS